jgi:short subunit fatty acids transporter
MIIIAKREKLDNFKLKIDKKLSEQIMKFEEMGQVKRDLGKVVSDSDLIYILIKALSASYKEKIFNALAAGLNIKTFP